MSKQIPARRTTRRIEVTPRELWLAGLGAVSLTRKQVLVGLDQAVYLAQQLQAQAAERLEASRETMAQAAEQARELAEAGVEGARARLCELGEQAEQVLRPLLAKFGVTAATAARHKPAARKPRKGTRRTATRAA